MVIEYSELSGFTTREYAFQQPPVVLISGDGRVFTTGPQIEIYPGPALPNIQVGTITEEGDPDSSSRSPTTPGCSPTSTTPRSRYVADASTATVTMNVDGASWVHSAYALGIGDRARRVRMSPEREALREFTDPTLDLADASSAPTNSVRSTPSSRRST